MFRHASAVDGRRRVREAAAVAGSWSRWVRGRGYVRVMSPLCDGPLDDGRCRGSRVSTRTTMGAMGRRFLFPSCRLTGAPCEGGSWWWRRREKLRRDGGRDGGSVAREVCPLRAHEQRTLNRRRPWAWAQGSRGGGGRGVRGWWMVGRGPGCSELPAYGGGKTRVTRLSLWPWVSGRGF